jgi:hypothetical protein
MGLGKGEAFIGGKGRPDFVPLQTKHPRKRVRDADVVVDNEDTSGR